MTRTTTGDRRAEPEPGRIARRSSVALAAGRAVGWSLLTAMWVSCAAALTSWALLGLTIWATRNEPPESMIAIVYWAVAIYGTVLAYLIWAVVALVKAPAGRRRAVLIGIVLVPAAMISYSSITAWLDDRRREQARVVIDDLPSTYMVEGVGLLIKDYLGYAIDGDDSLFGCPDGPVWDIPGGGGTNGSLDGELERLKEGRRMLEAEGFAVSTAAVSGIEQTSGERMLTIKLVVLGVRNDEAVVFFARVASTADGWRTYGSHMQSVRSDCVRSVTVSDIDPDFSETGPLPSSLPNMTD